MEQIKNLTIRILLTEFDRLPDLETRLLEFTAKTVELGQSKIFMPQPGCLLQFINLLGKAGVVYEVATGDSSTSP